MSHKCKCKEKKCISIDMGNANVIEAETVVTAILETFFIHLGTKIKYPLPASITKDWYMAHSFKEKNKISRKMIKIMEDEFKVYNNSKKHKEEVMKTVFESMKGSGCIR